jgi:hypothetical protein
MNDGGYRAYVEGIGNEYRAQMQRILDAAKQAGATVVVGFARRGRHEDVARPGRRVQR